MGKAAKKALTKPFEIMVTDPIKSGIGRTTDALIPTPDMPSLDDAPSADLSGSLAAEAMRKEQSRRRGRASTILTSSQGVASSANIGTKKLLGE